MGRVGKDYATDEKTNALVAKLNGATGRARDAAFAELWHNMKGVTHDAARLMANPPPASGSAESPPASPTPASSTVPAPQLQEAAK